jgi:hypothetical protein
VQTFSQPHLIFNHLHPLHPSSCESQVNFQGKNTPERKDYIMDKLIVPVEE